jgi:Large polyvalent protein-associated domain 7
MILLAKLKGWKGIHLTGTEEFKERAFVNAVLTGAYQPDEITGYTPSTRALEILEMAGKGPSQKKTKETEQKVPEPQVGNNHKQKI